VIETPDGRVVGIEVKPGATVLTEDLAGLRNLANLSVTASVAGYVLYTGHQDPALWRKDQGATHGRTLAPRAITPPNDVRCQVPAGKKGCGVPLATYLASRSMINAQVWAVWARSTSG